MDGLAWLGDARSRLRRRSCRTAWAGSKACCGCAVAHKIGCRCLLGLCGFYRARLRAQSLETPRPSCGLLYLQAVPPQTYWFGQWRQRDRAYLHLCAIRQCRYGNSRWDIF